MLESWNNAEAYERFMGRWSRLVAREFVEWLAVPPKQQWLEIGCGTGALTQAILDLGSPQTIRAIDPSGDYVSFARTQVTDGIADFGIGDISALRAEQSLYDVVVSGLVLNRVPDPAVALNEMGRVTANGGMVAAYVWDYAGGMEFLRYFWDVVMQLDDGTSDLDEGRRFPLCRPEALRGLFGESGLREISVNALEIPTVFGSFEDYWQPFTWGQGAAGSYCVSLSDQKRQTLKEGIRAKLPTKADGSISLTARAWAIRGTR